MRRNPSQQRAAAAEMRQKAWRLLPPQQQAERSVGRAGFPRYRDAHSGFPGCGERPPAGGKEVVPRMQAPSFMGRTEFLFSFLPWGLVRNRRFANQRAEPTNGRFANRPYKSTTGGHRMKIAFSTLGCPDFGWMDTYAMARTSTSTASRSAAWARTSWPPPRRRFTERQIDKTRRSGPRCTWKSRACPPAAA